MFPQSSVLPAGRGHLDATISGAYNLTGTTAKAAVRILRGGEMNVGRGVPNAGTAVLLADADSKDARHHQSRNEG